MNLHPAMPLPKRPRNEKHEHSISIPNETWNAAHQKAAAELGEYSPSMNALIANLLAAYAEGECLG
jgi:hypothetical protein